MWINKVGWFGQDANGMSLKERIFRIVAVLTRSIKQEDGVDTSTPVAFNEQRIVRLSRYLKGLVDQFQKVGRELASNPT